MPEEPRTELIQFCDKALYEQAFVYGLFILSSIPFFVYHFHKSLIENISH